MALDSGAARTRGWPSAGLVASHRSTFERFQWTLRFAIAGVDVLAVGLAILLAVALRDTLPYFDDALNISSVQRVAGGIVILWMTALWIFRSYSERYLGAGSAEYGRVFLASLTTAGAVAIAAFLAQYQLSRGFFVIAFTLGSLLLVATRRAVRRVIHRQRANGRLTHRVVLVGSPGHVDHLARILGRERWLGFRVAGAITPPSYRESETAHGVPVIGSTAELTAAIDRLEPSVVIFVGGYSTTQLEVRQTIWDLDERGMGTFIVPSITDVAGARLRMQPVGGLPLVQVAAPSANRANRITKRLFDITGSSLLLLLAAPLLTAVAIAVKLADRGPILYSQTRVGRDGNTFQMRKIRTMVPHADKLEAKLREQHSDPGAVLFKMTDDPRITKPGRFLRRFSIDELPQLWNVLWGDMSLVGPRPALPHEVARLTEEEKLRHRVRPGLTGLWQVSGRANLTREDAARLDLYYVENWSLAQDLLILARTARAVLSSDGAY